MKFPLYHPLRAAACGLGLACCMTPFGLKAANITWSSPVVFTSLTTAQIFTNTPGTIIGAVGFGIEEPTPVIFLTNYAPVVFDIFADPTIASVSGTNGNAYGTGTFPAATAYTTGNTNFNSVLNNFVYNNKTLTINLINLVPGATYSAQIFCVDDRTNTASNNVSFQNPAIPTNISSTYAVGTNAYVVGTFTVPTNSAGTLTNYTIQQNLSSTNGVINALVLRAVSFTPAITFTQQPTNNAYVDLGSNASFSAMAYGPEPLVPQWQAGPSGGPYTNLVNNGHYSGVNTYNLSISNVVASDAQVYTLKLTSGTNSSNSTAASLSTFGTGGNTYSFTAAQGSGAVNNAIYVLSPYSGGPGGTVQMGPGTFYGNINMYPGVTLKGAGISNTIIQGTLTEGAYGNTEYSENFSVYGGVSASAYSQGGSPGAGIFFGNYNNDDHFQWYKNIEVEGTDIAMQLIGVFAPILINCNFHDNGLGYSHSIYFTGDYNVLMTNCISSWSLAGDGVHNDFTAANSYQYFQSDYSGNTGLGLLVQQDNGEPTLSMIGCTVQFNGQDGGEGDGVNCSSSGVVQAMRMDWNNGYGFNDNSSGTEDILGATGIGNTTDYFYCLGTVEYFSFNATQSGSEQFAYDACLAPNIAGPDNTADWVTAVNGYGGGGTEGNVGFFNGSHPINGSITWPYVGAPTNGSYRIHLWYANGSSNTLAMPMTVNGTYVGTVEFPPTGSWTSYVDGYGLYANLTSSNNTVSLSVLSPGIGAPVIQAIYVPTATPSTPAAPTGLTFSANTNAPVSSMVTWITLNWNPVSQATCYNIYRNGRPIAKNVTATTFTDTHVLGCGTSEGYEVKSYNQSGESASYASVTAKSIAAFPLSTTATGEANSNVVSWPASPNAKSYTVYRSTTSGGPYKKIATTASTSYTDVNVVDGTSYYYTVSATDGISLSMNSPQSGGATPYKPYSGSPVLLDVDFGSAATQSGAAVLGTNGDHWNAVSATTTTMVNSAGTTLSGVGLSLGGSGVYTDTGGTPMDSATTALMEDYAYGYTGATANITVNLTGLTSYLGANVTVVVYASGDNPGQGASLSMSGATGGNSGSTLSTTAASRHVSAGNGVAYQTYTGTLINGSLTIKATELSGQSFTVINGIQVYLTAP